MKVHNRSQKDIENYIREIESQVNYYKTISEAAREFVFIIDTNKIVEYVNSFAVQAIGYPREKIIGWKMEKLFPPEIASAQKKSLDNVVKTGETRREIAESHLGNKKVWLDTILVPLKNSDGVTQKVLGISRDITERKKAEEEIRESEEKFRILFENANDGIYIRDKDGTLEFVNDKICEVHGYTRKEMIGRKSWEFLHPEDFEQMKKKTDLSNLSEAVWEGSRIICKSGEIKYVDINTVPFKTSKGEEKVFGISRDITHNKEKEEELRRTHERLVTILNSLDAIITIVDMGNFNIIFLNNYAKQLYGDKTGDNCKELFCYGNYQVCNDCIKDKIIDQKGNPKGSFNWERYSEKEEKWYQYSEKAITWTDGRMVKLQVAYNITHRKMTEEALKRSEEKYKLLIEEQGEGIGITNVNEVFTFANPAAEKIFEVKKGGLKNRSLKEFTSEQEFKKFMKETQKRLKGEKSTYEVEIICPGGKKKNLHLTATPKYNKKRKFEGTFGIFRDITQEKRIEKELRDSEERFKRLTEVTHEGIIIHQNGDVIDVNPSILKMFKITEEEAKKRKIYDFIVPKYHGFVKSKYLAGYSGRFEFEAVKNDGVVFPVEVNVRTVKRDGETMRVVAINDISERKKREEALRKSEKELREANATKDKFFSILAHDLRSPVSNLMQFAKLMEENYEIITKDEEFEYIRNLVKIAEGTYNLLENLLTWSRLQLDKVSVIPEDFELSGIVESAVQLYEENYTRKNIQVEVKPGKNIHPYANQESIYFVIRNLFLNAIKFTPAGGKITITASQDFDSTQNKNRVEICIEDTGIGIPPDRVNNIFHIDTAFSTEGTAQEQGTGLGLILCKEFVERNGGEIHVKSKLGKGSKFCFTIPAMR